MTTVLLIRHGENEYTEKGKMAGRLPGVHLSEKGVLQARALAAGLKGEKLKAIYASPLDRALETAQPIALSKKLEVTVRWGLEETDVGRWTNKSLRRLQRSKDWRQLQERPSRFRFPGGESIQEQQARLVAEMEELLSMHRERDSFACVFHSDPIKLVIAHYLGLPLDLFQRLSIRTASVSRLIFEDDRFMLGTLNEYFGEARNEEDAG